MVPEAWSLSAFDSFGRPRYHAANRREARSNLNVVLINPPAEQTLSGNNPPLIDEERGANPPIGLLYVAGYLRAHSGHAVAVIDCQAEGIGYAALADRLRASAPDVVGITALTLTLLDVIRTISVAREAAPGCRIVLGGPHVYLYPEESARLDGVDFVIAGEGEEAFCGLVNALDSGGDPTVIAGVSAFDGDRLTGGGPAPPIEDLDAVPFPARELTDVGRYFSVLHSRRPVTTLITSRGCPYRCTFCSRPHLGRRFRARSAANVVGEMVQCIGLGVRSFMAYDDTFTIDRGRVLEICRLIRDRRLDVEWDIRARVDQVDAELLRELRRAGCARAYFGAESGTARHLDALQKGVTLEQTRTAFRLAREAGVSPLAYFMVGLPGETRDDVEQTIRFALELPADVVHCTILTPFPGTEIYRQALERGIIGRDVWREFAADPRPGFEPPYWEEHLERDELLELIRTMYRRFYGRPGYALRSALRLRSLGELKRKARAAWRVIRWRW